MKKGAGGGEEDFRNRRAAATTALENKIDHRQYHNLKAAALYGG